MSTKHRIEKTQEWKNLRNRRKRESRRLRGR
jgi:hypothetical protein